MSLARSLRGPFPVWALFALGACGSDGADAGPDPVVDAAVTPDAAPPPDAAPGGEMPPDASPPPEPDPDAGPPPDAGSPYSPECIETCDHVAECFTQQEPMVCACAGSSDPTEVRDACLSQCNALFVSTLGRTPECEVLAESVRSTYPDLFGYCTPSGACPGGETDVPAACVAFGDRLSQCTVEACPALEAYSEAYQLHLQAYCKLLVTGQVAIPVEPTSLTGIAALAEQPCEAPDMQEAVARRLGADRQFSVAGHLAEFCATGPLASEETCQRACQHWIGCGSDILPERCAYLCLADAGNSPSILCGAEIGSCDELAACDFRTGLDRQDKTLLANLPSGDCRDAFITPAPGEEGHQLATRLTPPSYPWRVDAIQYANIAFTDDAVTCSTEFDERVEVSVMEDEVPLADPMPVAVIPVEGMGLPSETVRFVEVPLPEPIVLQAGQHLLVGVTLTGRFPQVSCVLGCGWRAAGPNRFFWSNAVSPPYSWAELSSFNITAEEWMFAVGEPVE